MYLTLLFYKEIKGLTTIIIIILIIICIILGYQLSKKIKVDNSIYQRNEELKKEQIQLEQKHSELVVETVLKENTLQNLEKQKENVFNELNKLETNLSNLKIKNEAIANEAFKNYVETLEQQYEKVESNYDNQIAELHNTLYTMNQELDKLKATRAAAHEALLKEKEIKENKDNYRLLPSQADLADARRLEVVKRELNKPRILSMLVWQTYWQPIAKKQFPIILQAKTKCGIYKITNIVTDQCYIGQSLDCYKRWNDHCKCGLGIDTPAGNKLYKSIQEYGLENFTFELLTECSKEELNEKEKYFIELYQSDVYGFNGTGGNK